MGQHSLYSRIVTLYCLTLSKRLRGRATGGGGGIAGAHNPVFKSESSLTLNTRRGFNISL